MGRMTGNRMPWDYTGTRDKRYDTRKEKAAKQSAFEKLYAANISIIMSAIVWLITDEDVEKHFNTGRNPERNYCIRKYPSFPLDVQDRYNRLMEYATSKTSRPLGERFDMLHQMVRCAIPEFATAYDTMPVKYLVTGDTKGVADHYLKAIGYRDCETYYFTIHSALCAEQLMYLVDAIEMKRAYGIPEYDDFAYTLITGTGYNIVSKEYTGFTDVEEVENEEAEAYIDKVFSKYKLEKKENYTNVPLLRCAFLCYERKKKTLRPTSAEKQSLNKLRDTQAYITNYYLTHCNSKKVIDAAQSMYMHTYALANITHQELLSIVYISMCFRTNVSDGLFSFLTTKLMHAAITDRTNLITRNGSLEAEVRRLRDANASLTQRNKNAQKNHNEALENLRKDLRTANGRAQDALSRAARIKKEYETKEMLENKELEKLRTQQKKDEAKIAEYERLSEEHTRLRIAYGNLLEQQETATVETNPQESAGEGKEELHDMTPTLTQKRIVVFGGRLAWINNMRALFPTVRFIETDNLGIDMNSVMRGADSVWMQTYYMGHKMYYKITKNAERCKTPVFYFTRDGITESVKELRAYIEVDKNKEAV